MPRGVELEIAGEAGLVRLSGWELTRPDAPLSG